MNPTVVKNIKTLFHALTVASLALSQIAPVLPKGWGVYIAIASGSISFVLNLITRAYPSLIADATESAPASA